MCALLNWCCFFFSEEEENLYETIELYNIEPSKSSTSASSKIKKNKLNTERVESQDEVILRADHFPVSRNLSFRGSKVLSDTFMSVSVIFDLKIL